MCIGAKVAKNMPFVADFAPMMVKALGKDHPEVATKYGNLANLLVAQRKYGEAEPLLRRAMEILQTKLGLDHPNTRAMRENYDRLQELKKQNSGNRAR
jgi:hypothetical protein